VEKVGGPTAGALAQPSEGHDQAGPLRDRSARAESRAALRCCGVL